MQPTAGPPSQSGQPEIPNRLYFRIGVVSKLTGVKPYVLRYWQSEIPAIAPKKSGAGQRLYRRKDVELILEIKHLLYEKRLTIEGARKALERRAKAPPEKAQPPAVQVPLFGPPAPDLSALRSELEQILALLTR